jgi:hypothetical protein
LDAQAVAGVPLLGDEREVAAESRGWQWVVLAVIALCVAFWAAVVAAIVVFV